MALSGGGSGFQPALHNPLLSPAEDEARTNEEDEKENQEDEAEEAEQAPPVLPVSQQQQRPQFPPQMQSSLSRYPAAPPGPALAGLRIRAPQQQQRPRILEPHVVTIHKTETGPTNELSCAKIKV